MRVRRPGSRARKGRDRGGGGDTREPPNASRDGTSPRSFARAGQLAGTVSDKPPQTRIAADGKTVIEGTR